MHMCLRCMHILLKGLHHEASCTHTINKTLQIAQNLSRLQLLCYVFVLCS